ncbi:hypothetical protein KL910_004289 [Ogataea haglerorum]|nr:hypothetical protein KL945_003482 [Ogataea haglerorum]KAG7786442.1 hypothetical protein KL910_004289 [Ogataea haglerorum]
MLVPSYWIAGLRRAATLRHSQLRTLRMRPDVVVKRRPAQPDLAHPGGPPRPRSKFQRANSSDIESANISKPPAQIEREMKHQFEKDDLDYDPEFVQELIQQSQQEEKMYKDILQDPEKAKEYTAKEMQAFVEWLVSDCEEFLANQDVDTEQRDRELEQTVNHIINSDPTPENMAGAFSGMENIVQGFRRPGVEKLVQFLSMICKKGNEELRKYIPLDSLLRIFNISTQIRDLETRAKCIHMAGNLIYSATDARADPINEMFYIESLMKFHKGQTAERLYNSRRGKPDVAGQRFWNELGVRVYLENRKIGDAEALAAETKQQFHYLHPTICIAFADWYLAKEQFEDAFRWWGELRAVMNSLGLIESLPQPETQLLDDEQLVYSYHNREDPVTFDHVTELAISFLQWRRYDEAMEILEVTTRRDKQFLFYFMDKFCTSMSFPQREMLRHVLQSSSYHPSMSKFMLSELAGANETRSLEQAEILDGIVTSLCEIADLNIISPKERIVASSIMDSIKAGQCLTTMECRELFKMLLRIKSKRTYVLATQVLNEMNETFERMSGSDRLEIFPPVSSHFYLLLVQLFGRQKKPDLAKIEAIMRLMESKGIGMVTLMANQLILTYKKAGRPDRAIEFAQHYMNTNENFQLTNDFCKITLSVYRYVQMKSATHKLAYRKRLQEIQDLFRRVCRTPGFDVSLELLNELTLTFLKYGDYVSAICALQLYGMVCNKSLEKTTLLLVNDYLEKSFAKMKSKLTEYENDQMLTRLSQLRETIGFKSLRNLLDNPLDLNWRDAASYIIRYLNVFDFNPNPFSLKNHDGHFTSTQENQDAKTRFEDLLVKYQEDYQLPKIRLSDIVQL